MTRRLGGLILTTLFAASCAAPPVSPPLATGSLSLSLAGLYPSDRQIQALPAGAQARIQVSGPGLEQPLSATASISGDSLVATLTGIPTGPNRIIAVETLDADGNLVPGGRFRTTATLKEGKNAATLSAATTPRGDAFAKLLEDGSDLARTLDAERLQDLVEAIHRQQQASHFGLIDGTAIADALLAHDGDLDALAPETPAFVQKPATLRLSLSGLPDNLAATVWVDDPVSPKQAVSRNGLLDLSPVKPGTWRVHARAGTLATLPLTVTLAPGGSATASLSFRQTSSIETPLDEAMAGAASGFLTLEGKTYLVMAGGLVPDGSTSRPTARVRAFDGSTWRDDLPDMPVAVTHAAFASDGTRLAVAGGYTSSAGTLTDVLQIFDATTRSWTLGPNLPYMLGAGSAAYIDGTLYVTGGKTTYFTEFSLYTLSPDTGDWVDSLNLGGPFLAEARYGAASAVYGNRLYVFSGSDTYGNAVPHVDVFDRTSQTIRSLAPIPTPRIGATAFVAGDRIIVAGGTTRLGQPLGAVEAYDPATNTWTVLAPLQETRAFASAGFLNGRAFVLGGHDGLFPRFEALPTPSVESFGL